VPSPALRRHGFLVVANHGVPQQLVDGTFTVTANFFRAAEGDKLALKVGKYNIGYCRSAGSRTPFAGQQDTRPNFSETSTSTRDRARPPRPSSNDKPLVG